MTDEQFTQIIDAIETQNQIVEKIWNKVNTFINIIYFMILLGIFAAACSVLGVL